MTRGSAAKCAISLSNAKSIDAQKSVAILIRIWVEPVILKVNTVALLCVIRNFLVVSTTVQIFATWDTVNLANGFQSSQSTVLAILPNSTHQLNVGNHFPHVVVLARRSCHVATTAE